MSLCRAITLTGLIDTLNDAGSTFTLFAPNNSGFANVDLRGLTTEQIEILLLFHVVSMRELESEDLTCRESLRMANGGDSTTICTAIQSPPTSLLGQAGAGNVRGSEPTFVEVNVKGSNGVIHILSEVMLFEPLPTPPDVNEPPGRGP